MNYTDVTFSFKENRKNDSFWIFNRLENILYETTTKKTYQRFHNNYQIINRLSKLW